VLNICRFPHELRATAAASVLFLCVCTAPPCEGSGVCAYLALQKSEGGKTTLLHGHMLCTRACCMSFTTRWGWGPREVVKFLPTRCLGYAEL
jgi:hypothetical protein